MLSTKQTHTHTKTVHCTVEQSRLTMVSRQPRADASWKKLIKKNLSLLNIRLFHFMQLNLHCINNVSDLLLIGMNTYSLFRRFLLKNFSADFSRTILKVIIKGYICHHKQSMLVSNRLNKILLLNCKYS